MNYETTSQVKKSGAYATYHRSAQFDLGPTTSSNERLNLNISAYRVLFILSLLIRHRSLNLTELNKHLYENSLIQRTYNNETITKYINTLRKVGCNIPKGNSRCDYRYVLSDHPFPLTLSTDELRTLYSVLELATNNRSEMDESFQRRYLSCLKHLAWMLPLEQKAGIEEKLADFKPHTIDSDKQKIVQRFRDYCRDALALEVDYLSDPSLENIPLNTALIIEPIRVLHEGKHAYLLGKERKKNVQLKLNLQKIQSVRQLPGKVNHTQNQKTAVVFQLYGRLAKSYRLYTDEEIIFTNGDIIQVRAKTDDLPSLLARIMKYGTLCQVISPFSVRQEMKQRIKQLLHVANCKP